MTDDGQLDTLTCRVLLGVEELMTDLVQSAVGRRMLTMASVADACVVVREFRRTLRNVAEHLDEHGYQEDGVYLSPLDEGLAEMLHRVFNALTDASDVRAAESAARAAARQERKRVAANPQGRIS